MKDMEFSIPRLSEQDFQSRLEKIKPVVERDGDLYYIKPCDPTSVAFNWDPKLTEEALDIEPLCTIRTLHGYGYHGFFKPSISEALSQIPAEHLDKAVAFKVRGPETVTEMNSEKAALDAGFHVAKTTLYSRKAKPSQAKSDPPDPEFQKLIQLGLSKLGGPKMEEICDTKVYLDKWANGQTQPMRYTRTAITNAINEAIGDQKSDPTIEPGEVVLDKLAGTFYIVEIASHFEYQKLWEELWGYPHGRRRDLDHKPGTGWIQPIGKVGPDVVEVNLHWDRIGMQQICFIRPESQVVDQRMIRKWIAKYASKIAKTDSWNYFHMVQAVLEKMNKK